MRWSDGYWVFGRGPPLAMSSSSEGIWATAVQRTALGSNQM